MAKLLTFFLRGLVVVAPLVITVWICVQIFITIDSWLGLTIPGAGFLATIVLITCIGFLASSIVTRSAVSALDMAFEKLPFVRLLYTSTKDLLNAFVGERRRFDKPVLVSLGADSAIKLVGFLTSESVEMLGVDAHVTVYIPTSYSVAGHVLVVPADRVERLDADATHVLAYIVSGGVTNVDVRT